MIDSLISEWGEAARQWAPVALDATIKASIVVVAAAIACRLATRASAATRHFMWLLGIVAISVLPLLSRVLPRWHVLPAGVEAPAALALPLRTEVSPLIRDPLWQPRERPTAIAGSPEATSAMRNSSAPRAALAVRRRSIPFGAANVAAWIFGVWSVGAFVVLLRLVLGVAAIRRTIRRSSAIDDSEWSRLLQQCCRDLGVRRTVALHRLDRCGSPAVWSIFGSTILLSLDADHWSVSRRRAVLRHELAHVIRRDCLTHLLARAALAVHWFNPLAWYALRRLNAERECACDNLALGKERRSVGYAEHVLHIAAASGVSGGLTVAPAMARQTELEGRIVAILDEHRNRRVMKRATGIVVAAALFFATLPLAAVACTPALQNSKVAADQNKQAGQSRVDRLAAMLLQDHAASNRDAADEMRLLGRDHPDAASVVASLLGQLQSDDAALRRKVTQALGYTRNPRAVAPLVALLDDPADGVHEWAIRSLGTIGDAAAIPTLAGLLFDGAAEDREWASIALGQIGGPRAVQLLRAALSAESYLRDTIEQSIASAGVAAIRNGETPDDDPWIKIARTYISKYGINEEKALRHARLSIRERDKFLEARSLEQSLLPLTPEMKILVESDPVLRFWRQQVEVLGVEIATARPQPQGNNQRHIKILKERRRQYAELQAGKRAELINDLREREKWNKRNSPAGRRQQAAESVEQIKQRRLIAGLDKMAARINSGRDR